MIPRGAPLLPFNIFTIPDYQCLSVFHVLGIDAFVCLAYTTIRDLAALGVKVKCLLLRFAFTFGAESKGIGLWSWSCSIDGADVSSDPSHSSVFENAGFGVVHRGVDSFRDGFQGNYPQRTLQFLALYHEGGEGNTTTAPGLYFATHDPHGSIKSFVTSLNDDASQLRFEINVTPPDAGVVRSGGETIEIDFPVVIAPFGGDWFDAAQIYRTWALAEADWTQQGPLSQSRRNDTWLWNVTTWVNSHWQQMDIFNVSGGDPNVIAPRMRAIVDRFGLGEGKLALHWYEWDDLGYDHEAGYYGSCPDEVTCGFDTHCKQAASRLPH